MDDATVRVALVGDPAVALGDAFDVVSVGAASELTALSLDDADPSADPDGEGGREYDGGGERGAVDCVVCPAAELGAVGAADLGVPVVAVVDGDAEGAAEAALADGATDVVAAGASPQVARERVLGAVARGRLPAVESALAAERSLLSDLFQRVPIHLYVKDEEARHVRVSEAYLDDPAAFLGKRDVDVVDAPETRRSYADDVRVIETGEPIIDREERVTPGRHDGWSIDAYLDGYDGVERPDASEEWLLTSKVPRYDDDGDVVGLIGVSRDISERKEYQRRLEAQNRRLESFASVVSHDLRNPLSVASGYLELARSDAAGETPNLDRVERSLDRIEAIVDDVLTLAREGQTVEETRPVDLGTAVAEAWRTTDGTDRATLAVDPLPTVRADETRLGRLLENLFANCVQHGGSDVTVRVEWVAPQESADDDPGDGRERQTPEAHPPSAAGFVVADDGPGIPEADREQVFERGYSSTAEGTGFGLAIVRGLAEAHGWTVDVTESDGGGARVAVRGVETVDGDAGRE